MKSQKPLNNKKSINKDSFLETFRDLGNDFGLTASDAFKSGKDDIRKSLFPFLNELKKDNQNLENDFREKIPSHFSPVEVIHREEKILFTRQQNETKKQVESLQIEINKLAKATGEFAGEVKEAEINVMSNIPDVGTYHLNFFEQLKKVISDLRAKVQESSLWLSAWNQKSQKKNYYWGQFKKSGSKFLLSSDRSVATQAG